jgi:DNA polymerase III delta prime subunit
VQPSSGVSTLTKEDTMAKLSSQQRHRRKQPAIYWSVAKDALSFALSDIWEDQQLLDDCYCSDRERPFDEEHFAESVMAYIKDFSENENRDVPTRPFVIYGDPGVGKTTFLHHTLRATVSPQIPIELLSLDYRQIALETLEAIRTDFYQQVANHLWQLPQLQFESSHTKTQFFEKVFSKRLRRSFLEYVSDETKDSLLREKIKATIESFLKTIDVFDIDMIEYLYKHTGKTFIIIMDNFDHDIRNQRLHLNILLVARDAIDRLRCPVFIPMRNYTKFNAFDRFAGKEAMQYRSLQLSRADERSVLNLRHKYATSKLLERKREEIEHGCQKYQFTPQRLVDTLNMIWDVFNSSEAFKFLVTISNGNLRTLFDVIHRVLQSGYFGTTDALADYSAFLKAAILDNNAFFEPEDERNRVINIYDNNEPYSWGNSLIRIRILQMLQYAASPTTVDWLLSRLSRAGYEESSIMQAVRYLAQINLLEVLPALETEIDKTSIVTINKPGNFYLEYLMYNVHYLENVLPSTNVSQVVVDALKRIQRIPRHLDRDAAKAVLEDYLTFARFVKVMEDQERNEVQTTERLFFDQSCPRVSQHLGEAIKWHFSHFFQKDYSGYQYNKPMPP